MRTTIALVMALAASNLAFAEESQRWNQDDGANDLVVHISVADGLHSEVITRLRNQYEDQAVRERSFADRYGADHPGTTHLRALMQEVRRKIDDETKMIAASAEDDYETALAREKSLAAEVEQCLK